MGRGWLVQPSRAFAIGWIGEGWCFFLNGISFLAVIIALLMMRLEKIEIRAGKGSPLQNFIQGFRFAMSDRPIRSALLLLSLMSMLGLQYSVFLPIFANDVLHGGARASGLLMSFAGVGAVIGALHFAARTDYKGLVEWIAATSTTCAWDSSCFLNRASSGCRPRCCWLSDFRPLRKWRPQIRSCRVRVPDELRGRIMAVYATMFMGVQPIGALIAGGVAKRIGAPHALAAFGTACLLGSLFFIFRVAMRLGAEAKLRQSLRRDWSDRASLVSQKIPLQIRSRRKNGVDLGTLGGQRTNRVGGRRVACQKKRLAAAAAEVSCRGGRSSCRVRASIFHRGISGMLLSFPKSHASCDPSHCRNASQE